MDIKIKKINFEGNILKVIKATVTEMRGINNHQKYNFDLYQIEARSPEYGIENVPLVLCFLPLSAKKCTSKCDAVTISNNKSDNNDHKVN